MERVIIDGREAYAAYLNDRLQPVAKGEETLVKVIFLDNHQTLWLTPDPEVEAVTPGRQED
ncbi:MAG: hypothetical protein J2P48_08290 [Alphaproteobacteria bacterium]|nr:hypothetical protein [Alphaproteobacteria bacterium]